jgi:hypothetical protein
MFQTTNQWGLIWDNIKVVYQWPHIDTSGPSGRDPESSCRQDSPLQAWLGKSAADLRDWSRKLLALILLPSITQWPSMAYWNPNAHDIWHVMIDVGIWDAQFFKAKNHDKRWEVLETPLRLRLLWWSHLQPKRIPFSGATMNFRWNSSVDIVRNALARKQFSCRVQLKKLGIMRREMRGFLSHKIVVSKYCNYFAQTFPKHKPFQIRLCDMGRICIASV